MTPTIDERLNRDARALDALELSDAGQRSVERRLAATRQVAEPPPRAALPAWVPAAVAATVLVAVATFVAWPGAERQAAPAVAVTVPEPVATPGPALTPAVVLRERIPLQRVSQAAPLEAEWVAIQEDLERARNRIEHDMPVRF